MLDELERLHKAATPGPWQVEWDDDAPGGSWIVIPARPNRKHPLAWTGAGVGGRADADAVNAAMNALPALLRVARAALRYADLDGLPCDYAELDPDLDWQDRKTSCPGIEKNGVPCHWCDLRAALAALTTTTAPPASE